ncbi:Hypothetical protein PENO1_079300 [Penicillium occitanis (nom. inval.)]|nr:Hypothetical protein PENO1_079300 [Penicillium occitanis (nom. inval.)]PCG94585.1 hypothetical protein PENOC_081960 [Penicillium occitanis (nom. inval.)]
MVPGLTRDIECDPVLEMNSRNSQRASSRPVHTYERRPRRKTKADRYEPYKGTSVSEQGSPRPRHSQKRAILRKRNNSRVAEKFRAQSIKTGRLTLTSNENLGIFKKGKTSSPISSLKVSYPNFSELQFLAKGSQATITEEEVQTSPYSEQHGISPSGSSFDALIDRKLSQVLTDCCQLSVPYERYMPRHPNSRLVSLEDLKDLCRDLDNMWSKRKEGDVFDHATDNDSHSVRHASCGWTRTEAGYFSTPGNDAARDSERRKEMLDMLLDSVEDFDQDMALEVLAELVEPGADKYELQAADRTEYAHDIEAIASSHSYDVPRTLDDCGGSANVGHGEHSVISSTMQRRYDDNMIPIGRHIRDSSDMERAATAKTSALPISSGFDDRQFQFPQRPTPALTTTYIPAHGAVRNQQTNTTSRRPFWRCNKLY